MNFKQASEYGLIKHNTASEGRQVDEIQGNDYDDNPDAFFNVDRVDSNRGRQKGGRGRGARGRGGRGASKAGGNESGWKKD